MKPMKWIKSTCLSIKRSIKHFVIITASALVALVTGCTILADFATPAMVPPGIEIATGKEVKPWCKWMPFVSMGDLKIAKAKMEITAGRKKLDYHAFCALYEFYDAAAAASLEASQVAQDNTLKGILGAFAIITGGGGMIGASVAKKKIKQALNTPAPESTC